MRFDMEISTEVRRTSSVRVSRSVQSSVNTKTRVAYVGQRSSRTRGRRAIGWLRLGRNRSWGGFTGVVDEILAVDRGAPPKQRHTAKRIFERLNDEYG